MSTDGEAKSPTHSNEQSSVTGSSRSDDIDSIKGAAQHQVDTQKLPETVESAPRQEGADPEHTTYATASRTSPGRSRLSPSSSSHSKRGKRWDRSVSRSTEERANQRIRELIDPDTLKSENQRLRAEFEEIRELPDEDLRRKYVRLEAKYESLLKHREEHQADLQSMQDENTQGRLQRATAIDLQDTVSRLKQDLKEEKQKSDLLQSQHKHLELSNKSLSTKNLSMENQVRELETCIAEEQASGRTHIKAIEKLKQSKELLGEFCREQSKLLAQMHEHCTEMDVKETNYVDLIESALHSTIQLAFELLDESDSSMSPDRGQQHSQQVGNIQGASVSHTTTADANLADELAGGMDDASRSSYQGQVAYSTFGPISLKDQESVTHALEENRSGRARRGTYSTNLDSPLSERKLVDTNNKTIWLAQGSEAQSEPGTPDREAARSVSQPKSSSSQEQTVVNEPRSRYSGDRRIRNSPTITNVYYEPYSPVKLDRSTRATTVANTIDHPTKILPSQSSIQDLTTESHVLSKISSEKMNASQPTEDDAVYMPGHDARAVSIEIKASSLKSPPRNIPAPSSKGPWNASKSSVSNPNPSLRSTSASVVTSASFPDRSRVRLSHQYRNGALSPLSSLASSRNSSQRSEMTSGHRDEHDAALGRRYTVINTAGTYANMDEQLNRAIEAMIKDGTIELTSKHSKLDPVARAPAQRPLHALTSDAVDSNAQLARRSSRDSTNSTYHLGRQQKAIVGGSTQRNPRDKPPEHHRVDDIRHSSNIEHLHTGRGSPSRLRTMRSNKRHDEALASHTSSLWVEENIRSDMTNPEVAEFFPRAVVSTIKPQDGSDQHSSRPPPTEHETASASASAASIERLSTYSNTSSSCDQCDENRRQMIAQQPERLIFIGATAGTDANLKQKTFGRLNVPVNGGAITILSRDGLSRLAQKELDEWGGRHLFHGGTYGSRFRSRSPNTFFSAPNLRDMSDSERSGSGSTIRSTLFDFFNWLADILDLIIDSLHLRSIYSRVREPIDEILAILSVTPIIALPFALSPLLIRLLGDATSTIIKAFTARSKHVAAWQWFYLVIAVVCLMFTCSIMHMHQRWRIANTMTMRATVMDWREGAWEWDFVKLLRWNLQTAIERQRIGGEYVNLT